MAAGESDTENPVAVPRKEEIEIRIRERSRHRNRRSRRLLTRDPYHSLLSLPLRWLIFIFVCSHVASWVVFAPIYMSLSLRCELGASTFQRALYYSLITMSTIGFGTPDMQFNNCTSALFAIMAQTLLGLILNGVLVGTLYTKIARSKRKSKRIIFSEKACIRQIKDKYYFMFQTFDRSASFHDHNQLIDAHVRCYAVKRETIGDNNEPIFYQQCAMRLSHPNDDLGASLMMALPTLIVHQIDRHSPLSPPHLDFPSLVLRDDYCEVLGDARGDCGDAFDSRKKFDCDNTTLNDKISHRADQSPLPTKLQKEPKQHPRLAHIRSLAGGKSRVHNEQKETDVPLLTDYSPSHLSPNVSAGDLELVDNGNGKSPPSPNEPIKAVEPWRDMNAIQDHTRRTGIEVFVFVEAIETYTSTTVQARHSYRFESGDVEFEHTFVPCVNRTREGGPEIDVDAFHTVRRAPHNAYSMLSTPSIV